MITELLRNSILDLKKKRQIELLLHAVHFEILILPNSNLTCNSGEKWRFLFRSPTMNSTESYDVHQIFGFHLSRV